MALRQIPDVPVRYNPRAKAATQDRLTADLNRIAAGLASLASEATRADCPMHTTPKVSCEVQRNQDGLFIFELSIEEYPEWWAVNEHWIIQTFNNSQDEYLIFQPDNTGSWEEYAIYGDDEDIEMPDDDPYNNYSSREHGKLTVGVWIYSRPKPHPKDKNQLYPYNLAVERAAKVQAPVMIIHVSDPENQERINEEFAYLGAGARAALRMTGLAAMSFKTESEAQALFMRIDESRRMTASAEAMQAYIVLAFPNGQFYLCDGNTKAPVLPSYTQHGIAAQHHNNTTAKLLQCCANDIVADHSGENASLPECMWTPLFENHTGFALRFPEGFELKPSAISKIIDSLEKREPETLELTGFLLISGESLTGLPPHPGQTLFMTGRVGTLQSS